MNKKAITILGAIFLLIVGTLGFLIFQRRQSTGTDTTDQNQPVPTGVVTSPTPTAGGAVPTPVSTLPTPTPGNTAGGLAVTKLSEETVVSPILFYQGNGVAYFTSTGQLYQADLELDSSPRLINKRELGVPPKAGIAKVHWPSVGNNYLVELSSAGKKKWSVYVSDRGAYIDVPDQVTAIQWMPDGEQLLYLWLENNKTNLSVSPADLSTWQTITDIWENDDDIALSPDGRSILFWRRGSTAASNSINMVTPDGKLFRTVVKDGFNEGAVWSPDSQKFAFNRKGTNGALQLWVGNMFTGETQNTNVEAPVDRIIWTPDSKVLYVVSGSGPESSKLLKVDAAGQTQTEVRLGSTVYPSNLFMSADGKNLFFKNDTDGTLYHVDVSSVQAGSGS